MSRCFPYPPPGYEKRDAQIESIRDSIKLQKEREKAKKERRKEKKRQKNEKSRVDIAGKTKDEQHRYKKRHYEEMCQLNQQGGYHAKSADDEIEQLEKSGLTEEHGLPVTPKLSYSSDSTQNSAKRRKHGETDVNNNNHGKERGLRIRLPLLKHKDPEPIPSTEQQCLPGRPEATVVREAETEQGKSSFNDVSSSSTAREAAQYRDLAVNWTPQPLQMKHADSEVLDSSTALEAARYRDLVVNWMPQPLQMKQADSEDPDWLFSSTRQSRKQAVNGCLPESRVSALCSWPPRACYLPEADVYALPFAVPF